MVITFIIKNMLSKDKRRKRIRRYNPESKPNIHCEAVWIKKSIVIPHLFGSL